MSDRTAELRALAQRVVDAVPAAVAEEAVVTGSVSRGVADELSDIEMLLVTPDLLELSSCFEYARAAGLEGLGTWGPQNVPTRRVSGVREGVPIELIWWSRDNAESLVDAIFRGEGLASADALANGVAQRTVG